MKDQKKLTPEEIEALKYFKELKRESQEWKKKQDEKIEIKIKEYQEIIVFHQEKIKEYQEKISQLKEEKPEHDGKSKEQ